MHSDSFYTDLFLERSEILIYHDLFQNFQLVLQLP